MVDLRSYEGRPVVDAAVVTDDVAVWLPGPGEPSVSWSEVAPDVPVVLRLPGRSPRWPSDHGPDRLLAVVGDGAEPSGEPDAGTVRYLGHKRHGAVEVVIDADGPAIRVERCVDGLECRAGHPRPDD
ncbi:MAG: hypothetical protein M3O34_20105 [Chloroflexota bacterium]|nr:hypothetical protein [Chloroflexota bacterium]